VGCDADDCTCVPDRTCVDADGSGVAFSSGLCVAAGMLRRSDWATAPTCAGTCETSDCCVEVDAVDTCSIFSCNTGYFLSNSDTVCATVGCDGGAECICKECPKGSYQNEIGHSSVCKSCTTGRYGPAINLTKCTGCPKGKNLMDIGAILGSRCTDCAAGLYNPYVGQPAGCLSCPKAATGGALECPGCDPGTCLLFIVVHVCMLILLLLLLLLLTTGT